MEYSEKLKHIKGFFGLATLSVSRIFGVSPKRVVRWCAGNGRFDLFQKDKIDFLMSVSERISPWKARKLGKLMIALNEIDWTSEIGRGELDQYVSLAYYALDNRQPGLVEITGNSAEEPKPEPEPKPAPRQKQEPKPKPKPKPDPEPKPRPDPEPKPRPRPKPDPKVKRMDRTGVNPFANARTPKFNVRKAGI